MNATIESAKPSAAAQPGRSAQPNKERTAAEGRKNSPWRWVLTVAVLAATLVWGGKFAYHFWLCAETDDAYLSGHVHQISPQVDGRVAEVLVDDNQTVKAGDVLVRLDPLEYQIALQKAQAGVTEAKAKEAEADADLQQAQAQLDEAAARIKQAQAQLRQTEAQRDLARQNQQRNLQAYQSNQGAVSKSDLDTTRSALAAREADVEAAQANLAAANTGEAAAKSAEASGVAQQAAAQAAIATAEADVREAQRKLDRTTIVAPVDGRIGNKNVETGNRVQAGETLLALVEPDLWVVANFKETQLARMKAGQEAEITIDAIPGRVFHGRVDSLSPASGAEFALLPPDNATGNFTKVVQRVPVKIILDSKDAVEMARSLRPGLSVIASVRVR